MKLTVRPLKGSRTPLNNTAQLVISGSVLLASATSHAKKGDVFYLKL